MQRIYHDNFGANPSWYLTRIIVKDMQSQSTYYFIANCWLAIDQDDCMVNLRDTIRHNHSSDICGVFVLRSIKPFLWPASTKFKASIMCSGHEPPRTCSMVISGSLWSHVQPSPASLECNAPPVV